MMTHDDSTDPPFLNWKLIVDSAFWTDQVMALELPVCSKIRKETHVCNEETGVCSEEIVSARA